jgi:alkanesulfonate monooxygenase SsuD/methylene tetrahydromethanopterin reductase-like flavin-dependent oxidoreductase (luciferase family)
LEVRIGSRVCLVPLRQPLVLAKEMASVDHLSGGRFNFGIGAGWNVGEIANHGLDPDDRFELLAMKELWAAEAADFEGRHVSFHEATSWPKPAQRPHPPIIVGGHGPHVLDRVFEYGTPGAPPSSAGSRRSERCVRGSMSSRPCVPSAVATRSSSPLHPARPTSWGGRSLRPVSLRTTSVPEPFTRSRK